MCLPGTLVLMMNLTPMFLVLIPRVVLLHTVFRSTLGFVHCLKLVVVVLVRLDLVDVEPVQNRTLEPGACRERSTSRRFRGRMQIALLSVADLFV